MWIAFPKGVIDSVNAIQGGEIFVYTAPVCKGCTGMAMGDIVIAEIPNPKTAGPTTVNGLIIDPIAWQSTTKVFNGKNVDDFSQITLRISPSAVPPPLNPLIAEWDFSEPDGTELMDTANIGSTSPATWNTNIAGIETTGDEELQFSPSNNTLNGSSAYFDLAGAGSAITTGKVWCVMGITDFNFAGTPGERLRLGFTKGLSNSPVAEVNLRRVADNSIQLMGYIGNTLPTNGVQIYNSNLFDGLLEVSTEYDFDAQTYQIFYRFGGVGQWTSIGAASPMQTGAVGNALRLAAGDTATTGTGSWTDPGEYLHIDTISLTTSDPSLQNQPPTVSITEPEDGAIFDAGTNIALEAQLTTATALSRTSDFTVMGRFWPRSQPRPFSRTSSCPPSRPRCMGRRPGSRPMLTVSPTSATGPSPPTGCRGPTRFKGPAHSRSG